MSAPCLPANSSGHKGYVGPLGFTPPNLGRREAWAHPKRQLYPLNVLGPTHSSGSGRVKQSTPRCAWTAIHMQRDPRHGGKSAADERHARQPAGRLSKGTHDDTGAAQRPRSFGEVHSKGRASCLRSMRR